MNIRQIAPPSSPNNRLGEDKAALCKPLPSSVPARPLQPAGRTPTTVFKSLCCLLLYVGPRQRPELPTICTEPAAQRFRPFAPTVQGEWKVSHDVKNKQ